MMTLDDVLREIKGRWTYRKVPDDLIPFSCFVPDAGYSILAIPALFAKKAVRDPFSYMVPIPEKYVLEKGYQMKYGVPIVEAEYDDQIGLVIDEKYETWT